MMKRYSAARARQHLSEVLDQAERGEKVVIERRGVRFSVSAVEAAMRRKRKRAPRIEIVDPAVAGGQWTWAWGDGGLELHVPGSTRRS